MTRFFFILIGLLAIASIAGSFYRKGKLKDKSDKISNLSPDDNSIKKYKDTAQAQIGYLIEFMGEHDKNDSLFKYFVKSNFSENGVNEHMWTQVYEFKNGYFIGTLANDPVNIQLLKFNDTIKVRRQDIEDWTLKDYLTNTEVGSFSKEYLNKNSE